MAVTSPPRPVAAASPPARPSATAPAPPLPPREGVVEDRGIVRHDSVRALVWALDGIGKVAQGVDVARAVLKGRASIGGAVVADRFDSRGTLEVGGDVTIRDGFTSAGDLRIAGTLVAETATLEGTSRVERGIRIATALAFQGRLESSGDVRTALLKLRGSLAIGGTIHARRVEGKFEGESTVAAIFADDVHLSARTLVPMPIDLPAPFETKELLRVGRIEAESVELEGLSVQYLRAKRIVLGRRCHVSQAEGTVVSCHKSSHIGFESRTPPPRGLWR